MRVVAENYEETHTQNDYRNPRCSCAPRVNKYSNMYTQSCHPGSNMYTRTCILVHVHCILVHVYCILVHVYWIQTCILNPVNPGSAPVLPHKICSNPPHVFWFIVRFKPSWYKEYNSKSGMLDTGNDFTFLLVVALSAVPINLLQRSEENLGLLYFHQTVTFDMH